MKVKIANTRLERKLMTIRFVPVNKQKEKITDSYSHGVPGSDDK